MKKFIISIDAGTTSNRSILFDLKGKPVYSSQKEFTQYFPKSGWVEHDPEEIWRTTIKTLKDVIAKANKLRGKILSIGIEITLQIINVRIKIADITIMSLRESFSINTSSSLERWMKKIFIFINAATHPSNARSSLKKP